MAEETVVTNIVANANFSGLISDLNRVSASLANLQTQVSATNKSLAAQIAVVNRQFGDTLRSTGQFTTHFATVGSDVEKFGKSLDKGQLKLREFYRTWQGHHRTAGGLIRDLAQQQVRLQNAVMQPLGRNAEGMMQFAVHVPRGLDLIKSKTALAHQELMIMNRVMQEGANQLINWGKNTQWAGRQLTVGLTVPLAAFGKAASDAFKVADQELTRLTKVYGDIAGASARDLGRVRSEVTATAKDLAGSLGASFTETLALGADIAATGKQGEELLGSIRETTRLAVLGEVDRQEAMKATLAIQTAFNQNTEQLAESINFLNAVENQTSTTLNDLVEAIPRAGTIIKGLGGSVQDLALYLTAMREGGVSAAEGANALKSALGSLINPTNVAVAKFESFGIDLLGIVNNNAGDVTKTLFALQAALDTLDPLQKQQAIEQLFGKFQFARLGALFDNLGRQGSQTLQVLDLMKASSADLANIAGRELQMVTESASGRYRRALEELKADLASVGEQFLTINTYLIKFVDKIIDFASSLPGPIKALLSFLGGVTAIAGPLIMLTGVLGNFFGYIVKGVYHFKSLFKSAEGWRLLTPEILAANKAGSMAESTFYSDARAAQILNQALRDLSVQYDGLAARAASGAISVQPIISTIAGTVATPGGGARVVDPNNPLVGAMGSRASAHMVPRNISQPGTIFGLVPSSIPVNLAVGQNPQVYMQEALPSIPGVTSVETKKYGQVSTGIVASEAARHHAMTAALAMQSTEEVNKLKKMMAATGTVTSEFMQTFDDLVPITSQITQNAATQSAAIVAELRAGKLTVAQSRERIIALNLEIERMLGAAATEYAAATGRTINLTNVPTLNQPVLTATGKSNMREMFKTRTKGFFSNIARTLGVRTSGAGYNIHTTRPRKMNMGGYVYTMNDGNIVPGPNINADVVPAMLTPGEFVVNRKATAENLPLLQAINGQGSSGPMYNLGSSSEIKSRYSGRQLAHLTDAIIGSNLSEKEKLNIMRQFGLSAEQVGSRTTRIGSSLYGAYHTFFNQGTNNGNLRIQDAIDYLSGKTLIDPVYAKGPVVHTPLIAYEGLMADLGVPEEQKRLFASNIDRQIIADLQNAQNNGLEFLSDKPGDGRARSSIIGNSITKVVRRSGNIARMLKLRKLKQPGEVRVYNPKRETSDRFFPRTSSKASSILASVIAKRKMPAVTPKIASMFPSIRTQVINSIKRFGIKRNRGGEIIKIAARAASSRFRRVRPTNFGRLVTPSTGHSFPVPGIGGVYRKPDGSMVFVKPAIDERSALAELRATEIARRAHGLKSPQQTIRTMIDPTDLEKKRKIIVLESPYDPTLATGGTKFTKAQYFRQLVASLVRGDKDLSSSNVFGNVMADAGPAGVFGRASGVREYKHNMPSMAEQAMINLLGVKGGARKDFAKSTADLVRKMTPQQYNDQMIAEIDKVLPKLRKTVASFKLNSLEKKMYEKMITRLEAGKNVDWKKFHGIHSNVKLNRGGMVPGYAKGGMIPKYQRGGIINNLRMRGFWPGAASSRLNIQDGEIIPGPRGMGVSSSLMLGMAGSMGGGAAGGAIGGQTGALIGSMAGYALPSLIAKLMSVAKTANGFKNIVISIGRFIKMWSIPGAILTTLGLGIKALLDWRKRAEEAGEANRLAFGGTAESFASVGIKNYTTIADRIKNINEELELHRAQVRSTYASYTKAGPTGLTLTIEELKKAIENAKTAQKDYVDAFNNIDSSRVVEYATQLKSQFVAMGMAATEATNQIYAIIKASDKASQAVAAISSDTFRSIQKQTDGIKMLISGLQNELSSEEFNAEEFTTGLDTLLNSLMSYQKGLVGTKDENKKILDEADALALTLKEVGSIQGENNQISAKQLEQIKNQNIVYSAILADVESIQSVYAKIALYEQGFGRMLDLAKMTAQKAVDFANNLSIIQNKLNAITESTGTRNPLGPLAILISKTKNEADNANTVVKKLQKVDQDYYDAKIKRIQKSIDALEEERKKRLELLKAEKESSDFATTIEQAQNRLKNLIASGNMEAAAQEQLNIKKLSQERQYNLAVDSINEKFDKERKAKENEMQKIQDAKDRLAKGLMGAQTKAATKTADLAGLEGFRDRLEQITAQYAGQENPIISKDDRKEISNIFKDMKDAGGETAKAAEKMQSQFMYTSEIDHSRMIRGGAPRTNLADNLIDAFNKEINLRMKSNNDFKTAVEEFAVAVLEFKGESKEKTKTPKNTEYTKAQHSTWTPASTPRRSLFGRVAAGTEYLVGERGPELFKTDISGTIGPKYNIPKSNASTTSMMNSGTMGNISLTQTINAAPGMDERMLANLAAKQAASMISAAQANATYKQGRNVRIGNA